MFFPPCVVKQTDKKQGSAEVTNQKPKSLSLVVPWRVNGASMVPLRHRSDVKALRLRWKRVTFAPQTCDDCGVKIMPLRRKEGGRKLWEMSCFLQLVVCQCVAASSENCVFATKPLSRCKYATLREAFVKKVSLCKAVSCFV